MLCVCYPGLDVVALAQVYRRAGNTEITFADSLIRTPKDLKDKNVCVWTGGNELSLRALFGQTRNDGEKGSRRGAGSVASMLTMTVRFPSLSARSSDANHMEWDNDTSVNRAPGSDMNVVAQSFTETEFLARRCDAAAATR
jgi:hypothetical protein